MSRNLNSRAVLEKHRREHERLTRQIEALNARKAALEETIREEEKLEILALVERVHIGLDDLENLYGGGLRLRAAERKQDVLTKEETDHATE